MAAAVIMATSPVTTLAIRGNVADPIFILLAVLAADATVRALTTGKPGNLVFAAAWVGLAFQAKMLQAWLILPALFLAYLIAAPPSFHRRLRHVALAGLVAIAISLSWMSVVSLVPAHDRPYVDGTHDNSVFVQVFVYNGTERLGLHVDQNEAQPFVKLIHRFRIAASHDPPPSWHRLVTGAYGRDVGWLLPAALLSAFGVLIARRRTGRRDPIRAAALLWGSWLIILLLFFSSGSSLNSYYTAALVPAIAALCGTGLAVAWRARDVSRTSWVLVLTVVGCSIAYACTLVPLSAGVAWWLFPAMVSTGVVALIALLYAFLRRNSPASEYSKYAFALAALSVVLVPGVTTGVVVADGLGSFSTPYQNAVATERLVTAPELYQQVGADYAAVDYPNTPKGSIVAVYDTALIASLHIMVTGDEYLPIGGFLGANPSPTLWQLKRLVSTHRARWFVVPMSPAGSDPRLHWVRTHCRLTQEDTYLSGVVQGHFDCANPGGKVARA
jgi:4-amino-4-deoxy-L-arabinose transferase-like glycosyltransferase